ncbi:MAG: MarR family winged helix-turn-helix transcriptional regulator [Methanobrevibacter sp.]|jgi:DNA-binding MarR family transcriptional regulator|nr:MarR family winged helix-turn-helix transcriptional regulator [Candidatus Methanovirga meridionalis]
MKSIKKFDKNSTCQYPLAALISIIYRTHNVYLNRSLEELGITAGQVPFILHLLKKENISQNDFAEDLFIDKGTVAIGLKKLEEKGVIKRKRMEENKRKYIIYFTPLGRKRAIEIEKLNQKWEKSIINELKNIKKEDLMNILEIMSLESIKILE